MTTEPTTLETAQERWRGRSTTLRVQPYLFVVLECDRPWAGGSRHSLAGIDEVVVRRGAARGATREASRKAGKLVQRLVVTVPGLCLSSTHAYMRLAGGRWALEDAGSKNGTFLNGAPIAQAPLADADVFAAGRTLFVFRAAVPTPADTPLDVDLGGAGRAGRSTGAGVTLSPRGMARLDELRLIARSPVAVLLLGDTGTGKELLAHAVHEASGRAGDLVAVNCGALSASLLESLLFGHVRGAFSGATRDELGLVRAADRGTLFLDEIGDLPVPAQAALLRVLQEREVIPVGSTRPVKVDVRFVAATHRPLEELCAAGAFRADLFARLNGFVHHVPPLRERREDLGVIVGALLAQILGDRATEATLSPEVGLAMLRYGWPANVRELEQCLARASALAPSGAIELTHLPDAIAKGPRGAMASARPALSAEDAILRGKLVEELEQRGGNMSDVARSMKKARMQIQRWLKRLQIDATAYRR